MRRRLADTLRDTLGDDNRPYIHTLQMNSTLASWCDRLAIDAFRVGVSDMVIIQGRGNRRKVVHEMVHGSVVQKAPKDQQATYRGILCDILHIKETAK